MHKMTIFSENLGDHSPSGYAYGDRCSRLTRTRQTPISVRLVGKIEPIIIPLNTAVFNVFFWNETISPIAYGSVSQTVARE